MNLLPEQAMLFALFIEQSDDSNIRLKDLSRFLGWSVPISNGFGDRENFKITTSAKTIHLDMVLKPVHVNKVKTLQPISN